jgi:hypothetical protein
MGTAFGGDHDALSVEVARLHLSAFRQTMGSRQQDHLADASDTTAIEVWRNAVQDDDTDIGARLADGSHGVGSDSSASVRSSVASSTSSAPGASDD